jgi:hypothetical protein
MHPVIIKDTVAANFVYLSHFENGGLLFTNYESRITRTYERRRIMQSPTDLILAKAHKQTLSSYTKNKVGVGP